MSVQVDNPAVVQHSYQMMPGEMNLSYAGPIDHPVTQSHYESTHHQHHSTYVDETAPDEDSEFEDAQDALEAPSYYTQGETDEYSNIASRPDSELEDEYGHEPQVTQEQQQQHYVQSILDPPAEEIIKLADTIPHVDLTAELEKIKARLGVLVRPSVQVELIQLINENKTIQHEWSVSMEAYHKVYVVEAAAAAAEAAAKANAELKATLENDVRVLKYQIANLKRQLDAVASRRKRMVADAEDHRIIMRRNKTRD
ncbi:hypothetical protein BGX21_007696 [Mortierella sp. AD011]|nr:hypothetical protein BGX20_003593 [Mortierella sp. AD010]KAF9398501.1 hypothetical protein BGX21_007696 [Mortierella sp. AD011]